MIMICDNDKNCIEYGEAKYLFSFVNEIVKVQYPDALRKWI